MVKYGWQHLAEAQGYLVQVHKILDNLWWGNLSRDDEVCLDIVANSQSSVLHELEGEWRAYYSKH